MRITAMKYLLLCLNLIFLPSLLAVSSSLESDYEFSYSLDPNYTLYWNNPEDDVIEMAVEVDTMGWVGLGFSPNGGMIGSDIMMGWVKDGVATITDRFAVSESLPEVDINQDFELVEGYERDGKTVIRFRRELHPCDSDDLHIDKGTVRVIYSWHNEDPSPAPLMHVNRGTKSLNLLDKGSKEMFTPLPTGTITSSYTAGNVTIPSRDTTYWCKSFNFSHPTEKHHVIRIGINVDPRAEKYVHHALMYACKDVYPEATGECFEESGPIARANLRYCQSKALASWAVGGTDFEFPDIAGLPVGGSDPDFTTVLLEIHYNNPDLDTGVVDDSGFTFHYTNELRLHDAASISLGQVVSDHMLIPPRASEFLVQAYCPKDCTQQYLQKDINVFASLVHSHLVGVSMWTQIIRDGVEIGYVDKNLNYDFEYQEPLYKNPPVVIKPGDELILNCLYRTTDRDNFTVGGLSTRDEMCENYLYYYPKQVLDNCLMTYNREAAFKPALESFQCNKVDVKGSTTWKELVDNAKKIHWTEKIIRTLEVSQAVAKDGVYSYCDPSGNYSEDLLFKVNIPLPGVDYKVYSNRRDVCDRYNGTYYLGGDGDYYYDCSTGEAYFPPVTDKATKMHSVLLFITVLSVIVGLFYY